MVILDKSKKQLPHGELQVDSGTRFVGKGKGSTVGELYAAFHSQPIQYKGVDSGKRTDLLLTGKELQEDDWELYFNISL
jgi:hypothetical protein